MSTTPYRQSTFSCHSLSSEGSLKTFGERDDGSVISIPLASPESSSSSSSAKISLSHPSPRRFHSSHLGRPPGTRQTNTSVKRPPSISHTSPVHKTTPMKELEKMMADVKKENFDLKLRIYHLEEIMVKDVDQQLLEEVRFSVFSGPYS
ncbi:hypothetical protein CLU79DRAFT_772104 [Phycomyces nitens]|nr:hypothetical protein CLU79DRAFT_772104 [Phycomyces nitens]